MKNYKYFMSYIFIRSSLVLIHSPVWETQHVKYMCEEQLPNDAEKMRKYRVTQY